MGKLGARTNKTREARKGGGKRRGVEIAHVKQELVHTTPATLPHHTKPGMYKCCMWSAHKWT
jgi:hypothetical protein